MRLIVTARLSQKRAGQTGIDTQDLDARGWAEAHGHIIIAVLADRISGRVSPFDRRNLGPWLREPDKMAQYDGVLASKMDRYTRARDWKIREWAEENGKKLLLVTPELAWPPEMGDSTTPMIWDSLVNVAVAEWENTSLRWRRMQAHRISQDSFVGRPPYTHNIVLLDNGLKTLEPDTERADIILEAIDKFLAGASRRELVWWLREINAPWPTAREGWLPRTINNIFRNEALIGKRKQQGKTLRFEPILVNDDGTTDMKTWRELQTMLDATASRHGKTREDPALLNGLVWCANCGRRMHERHHTKNRPDGSVYTWNGYRCDGTAREPSKCRLGVNMLEMDTNFSVKLLSEYGDWPRMKTTVIRGSNHEDELEQNAAEIASLDPDAPDYDARHAELRAERLRIRDSPEVPDEITREADGEIGEHWRALDKAGRRKMLLDMGWRVIIRSVDDFEIKQQDAMRDWHVLSGQATA